MICQLAVHHGPADLRVAVLTEPATAADWDWAKWLPHVRSLDESSGRHLLAAAAEDVAAVLDELERAPAKRPRPAERRPTGPGHARRGRRPRASSEGATRRPATSSPARACPACGLVLVPTADQLPALCTSVVELTGGHGAARYREPAINLTIEDVLVAGMPEELARRCGPGALRRWKTPRWPTSAPTCPTAWPWST